MAVTFNSASLDTCTFHLRRVFGTHRGSGQHKRALSFRAALPSLPVYPQERQEIQEE